MMVSVTFERVVPEAVVPTYAHGPAEDAGMDLRAAHNAVLSPGETLIVSTGLKMMLPPLTQAEIRSRSGLASKGVIVANQPGTIDPSYRGVVGVILHNLGKLSFDIKTGDRIAQMVVMPYLAVKASEGVVSSDSARGEGGFGSTGK